MANAFSEIIADGLMPQVIRDESSGDANAVGPKTRKGERAVGLVQLMPDTAKDLGVTDRTDPIQSVVGGKKHLTRLVDKYDGDARTALIAYNWGEGNVDKYGVNKAPKESVDYANKKLGVPPTASNPVLTLPNGVHPSNPFADIIAESSPHTYTASDIPGTAALPAPTPAPTVGESIVGAGEAGLAAISGGVATLGGAIYGGLTGDTAANKESRMRSFADRYTYTPRTEAGKSEAEALGTAFEASKLPPIPGFGPSIPHIPGVAAQAGLIATDTAKGVVRGVKKATPGAVWSGAKTLPSDVMKGVRSVSGVKEPPAPRPVPYTPIQQTVREAHDAGMVIPEGLFGKRPMLEMKETHDAASDQNAQPAIGHLRTDIGLDPGSSFISTKDLQDVRDAQGARREEVAKDVPTVSVPEDVIKTIQNLNVPVMPKSFEVVANSPASMGGARPLSIPTVDVFKAASALREEAKHKMSVEYGKARSRQQKVEGQALLDAADALDKHVEESVADSVAANPDNIKHVGVIADSRKIFAKAQTIEDITSPSTGRPDFIALGKEWSKAPDKFDGGVATVGKIADAFPEAMRGFNPRAAKGENGIPQMAAIAGHAAIGNTHYAAGRALSSFPIIKTLAKRPLSKTAQAESLPENGYTPDKEWKPSDVKKTAEQVIAERAASQAKPPVEPPTAADVARTARTEADRARAKQLHADEAVASKAKMAADIKNGRARAARADTAMEKAKNERRGAAIAAADAVQKNKESEHKKWVDTVNTLRGDYGLAKTALKDAVAAAESGKKRLKALLIPESEKLAEMKKLNNAVAAAHKETTTAKEVLDEAHEGARK